MSVIAPNGARARRLSILLASTALVSAAALSMSATDANAACNVTVGGLVDCLAATTTTQTINTNGANPSSSDRIQEFKNGANIIGTIGNGVTVDGYGLQLSLTTAGPNTITANNFGTVTTSQGASALELNGNGGLVSYSGNAGSVVSTTAGVGYGAIVTNTGAGGVTVTNNGSFNSANNYGLFIQSNSGTVNVNGSGSISGNGGIFTTAAAGSDVSITSTGSITGSTLYGIYTATAGGNALISTGSTVSGGTNGIDARTGGTGTMTVTTGGAISGTSGIGIATRAFNGTTIVNAAHNVTAGTVGIQSAGTGSGLVDINHTAGTIAAGTIGIQAIQSGSGNIDISQTGGALNGTTNAVVVDASGTGNVAVSLAGGAVGASSGNVIDTKTTTGTTTITAGVNLTSTGGIGIKAESTMGTINIGGNGTITGFGTGVNAVALGGGNINVAIGGAIASAFGLGVNAASVGGNVLVATGSTISGDAGGISAFTNGNGTVTVTTGSAVTSASVRGITTFVVNGAATVNVGHNVTAATEGVTSLASGTGLIDIKHTAGTIAAGTIGIDAFQSGSGSIDISQTGGTLNGTTNAVRATAVSGNLIVSLTGGTVGTVSGNVIEISAAAANTTITTDVNLTSTGDRGILATSTTGNININGSGAIQGVQGIWTQATTGNVNITSGGSIAATGVYGVLALSSGGNVLVATGSTVSSATTAILAQTGGAGTVTVTTGGAVTGIAGIGIAAAIGSGTAAINIGHNVTAGFHGISAVAGGPGNIAITNNATVTGATNAVFGNTSGTFNLTNNGTLTGNVNVTNSNAASTFANSGTWNAGTATSAFSGNLNNTGTVSSQNGAAGQVITIAGNYTGNGVYRVDLDAAGNADRLNAGGTANLTGGSVNALFLPGAYVSRQYTILSAAGGLGGTTFTGGLTTSALPGFIASLSYTPTDVVLDLVALLGLGGDFNQNQQSVANTLNNFFNNGGTLPPGFVTLFGLTGTALGNALTQLSGENATGAQQGAFQLGNSYLSLLTDPFATNRVGAAGAIGFAQEPFSALPASVRSAFAAYTKAPPAIYAPRWDIWGAAFGGANQTRGEAMVGSNNIYTRAGGVAAGVDYRITPDALIGVSLAGGNINWSLTGNGVTGGGNSDTFLAGLYGKYTAGQAYLSGALTYSNYWASTNRTVTVAGFDQLRAEYNAHGFGGRIEGGYRLPVAYGNIFWTPYGAVQGQSFSTPNYGETAVAGVNQFALNFAGQTATAWRGELGVRTDKTVAIDNGSQLNLFGRFAYAHDKISNPAAAANFTALGLGAAPFTVYGARPSRALALVSAGAEWRLSNGVSFLAKFDGEFGDRSQTYTATGRIRYTW